jgi:hypothetical protein
MMRERERERERERLVFMMNDNTQRQESLKVDTKRNR